MNYEEYAYYDGDTYVMSGTKKEIAEYLGVKIGTVEFYQTGVARRRGLHRRILPLEVLKYTDADVDKLNELVKANGIKYSWLAEWADIKYSALLAKKNGRNKFLDTEVKRLEEVFRLPEGALLK